MIINTKGGGETLTPFPGSVVHNWYSGIATSGRKGGDVITIGTAGEATKYYKCSVSTHNFALGANINIRMYNQVNGIERICYDDYFSVGTDPVDLMPILGRIGVYGTFRIEASSDKAADDGIAMDYEYIQVS